MQSLLCAPSLSAGTVEPLLELLSQETLWGFSLHLLCATRRGQYDSSIEKLLDRCPQAIIAYANHHLQDKHMVCLRSLKKTCWDDSVLIAQVYFNFHTHVWCLSDLLNLSRLSGGRSCFPSSVTERERLQTAASC